MTRKTNHSILLFTFMLVPFAAVGCGEEGADTTVPGELSSEDPGALGAEDPGALAAEGPGALAAEDPGALAAEDPGALGAEVEADLLRLREEEKLARDVYLTLHEQWGTQVFENISASEQRHMDKVKQLLDAYAIQDPVTDDSIGAFADSTLARLYDDLVQLGMQSEVNALTVGATIEDLDIFDIREMRNNSNSSVVLDVYDKLECGSDNHLRAFTDQLSAYNAEYQAQYLDAAEVEAILEADHASCGKGNGRRRN